MPDEKRAYWRGLDNAGKMFSAASTAKDTRVFRYYCELKETVDPEILQTALNQTVKKYPIFLSVMRKGLFWHYLEKSELRPVVREEYKEPCSCLYVRNKKALLFEITYYKKRINVEIFHALTDGTGATLFIKELIKNYLYITHENDGLAEIEFENPEIRIAEQESDSFSKYYDPTTKVKRKKRLHAFQIKRGEQEYEPLQVCEATASSKELLKVAREKGVSITVLLTAVMTYAIHKGMHGTQEKKPVILMVPVNLRNIFPSESMLNFFGYIEPGYQFGKGKDSFEEVLAATKKYFDDHLTKEEIAARMNELIAFEKHKILRWAPLEIKNLGIRAGSVMAEKEVTAVFSNMGVMKFPEEYQKYIDRVGVYTSTRRTELCIVSCGEYVNFGFTSRYDSRLIQHHFYETLKTLGVKISHVEQDFPEDAKPNYEGRQFLRSFTFGCIAATLFGVAANWSFTPEKNWNLYFAAGILTMWFALIVGYAKRHNLMKNAMWQLLVVTACSVIWDFCTGWRGWSVNFVLPSVSILAQVTMLAISKIQSHSPREYMIYYVMATAYGTILPLVLAVCNVITFYLPAMFCIGFSIIFLLILIVFRGREFKEEMNKKFHI